MKMEFPAFIDNFVAGEWPIVSLVLLGLLVVLFLVQIVYHIAFYGRISTYRNPQPSAEAKEVGISVIVPLFDADFGFLNERLPVLLAQTLKNYEVVLVNVTGDEDFSEHIKLLKITQPRLSSTKLKVDPAFPISTKMALNVGIKAAHYDHLIFTLPDCTPSSERWAEMFARGFVGHDVVLGYASLAPRKGWWSRTMKCANMATSMRWLSSALCRRPYRGTLCNLGFTKKIYFEARGFNHLNLNMGEDDLFVMKIASAANTTVTIGGASTVSQVAWGGLGWWKKRRVRLSYPYKFYPKRVKWGTGVELWSRALFFAAAIAVALLLPLPSAIVAGSAVALRLLVVWLVAKRTARRLSERGLLIAWPLYDFFAPLAEALLAIERVFVPKYKWR